MALEKQSMKHIAFIFAFVVAVLGEIMSAHAADNGIVTVPTHHSVEQAADKLASLIEAKHIVLFARIDFAADAQRAGLAMQPSQLLVFGNPRARDAADASRADGGARSAA